jgi:cytochrome c
MSYKMVAMTKNFTVLYVLLIFLQTVGAAPQKEDFSIDVLSEGLFNPMEMDISSDGKVFIGELMGNVKVYDPANGKTSLIAHFDVAYKDKKQPKWDKEFGLMGLALAPDFEKSKWVYITYSKESDDAYALHHYVSRFKFDGEKLDRSTEQVLIKIPTRRDMNRLHEGGSLDFDKDGNLYISTGDNQWREIYLYAARTASNSAVLNGKILRIHPEDDGSYSIPKGNLFKPGTPKTLPEIYVMGCRNPFRIHVDESTGFLYWGENGPPDHFSGSMKVDKDKLPEGYDEFNQARRAGYHGWPFFVGKNYAYPKFDVKNEITGEFYDSQYPVNDLPMNHGLTKLPPVVEPMVWYSHFPSLEFPSLGKGSASAIAGPVYHHKVGLAEDAFPAYYDNCWFVSDYGRSWIKVIRLNEKGERVELEDFMGDVLYSKPINMKFDNKGHFYVLQYGKGGWNSRNGSLIRIRHDKKGENGLLAVQGGLEGLDQSHPGTKLIIKNNCTACHRTKEKVIGPSYQDVADRYVCDEDTIKLLSEKITKGSVGSWGNTYAMPGHGYLKKGELKKMLDVIFSLKTVSK